MFYAKDSITRERQLKVIELEIPLFITGSATSSSVAPTSDEPALVFMNTAGVNQTTAALDSGEAAPTFAAPVDATGLINVMVKVNEPIKKVVDAYIVSRTDTTGYVKASYLANTTGIDANGNKICLNIPSGVNLTSGNLDACLHVSYVPSGSGSY